MNIRLYLCDVIQETIENLNPKHRGVQFKRLSPAPLFFKEILLTEVFDRLNSVLVTKIIKVYLLFGERLS